MADLLLVQRRFRFSLKLAAVGVLLSALATWWFWSQLEFELDARKFIFSAAVTGALAIGWVVLLVFFLVSRRVMSTAHTVSDSIDGLPWGRVILILVFALIAAGWLLIDRFGDRAVGAFELLADGRIELLEQRVEADPDVLRRIAPNTGETLLQMAFRRGDAKAVAMLLARGASGINIDPEGRDPFVLSFGSPPMLASLLDSGMDPDHPDENGSPPLHHAVAMGATNAISALLSGGANVDVRDRMYRTPFMRATAMDQLDVAGLLLDQGADIDAANRRGVTAAHEATRRSASATACFLLERGADYRLFNAAGVTPAHLAASAGDEAVIRLFLATPGEVDLVSKAGWTPFDLAVKGGKYAVAEALLAAGANLNRVQASTGDTLLLGAVRDREYRYARFLIQHGADVEIPNLEGETALELIRQKELTSLLDALDDRK